jgi:flagellar biosynthesis protein FlhF
MRIKRYIVRDMREAVFLIKKDLGPDALIISSKREKQMGFIGLYTARQIRSDRGH